jgi:cell division protein FtsB
MHKGVRTWFIAPEELDARRDGFCTENMAKLAVRAKMAGMVRPLHVGRRKLATVAAAALAIFLGYHVVFGANGLTVYQKKRAEALTLQSQMHALETENDGLKGHVERLQNDPNAIEHQAREELHYTRPGEVIYAMPGEAPR